MRWVRWAIGDDMELLTLLLFCKTREATEPTTVAFPFVSNSRLTASSPAGRARSSQFA